MNKHNKILEVKRKFEAFQNLTEKQKVAFRCPQPLTTFPVMPYHYINAHGRMLLAFKHDASLDATLDAMVKSNILTIIPREKLLSKYGINSRSPIYYKGIAWESSECKAPAIDPVVALQLVSGMVAASITPAQCCSMLAVAAFPGSNAADLSKKTAIQQSAIQQHLVILTKAGLIQKDANQFFLTKDGLLEINSWYEMKIAVSAIPVSAPVIIPLPEKPRFLDWSIPTINLQSSKDAQLRAAAYMNETPEERVTNDILRNVWCEVPANENEEFPQIKAKVVQMSRVMNPNIAWDDLTEAEYDAREDSDFKTQYPEILDV